MKTHPPTHEKPVAGETRDELCAALEALARLLEYPGEDFGVRLEAARAALGGPFEPQREANGRIDLAGAGDAFERFHNAISAFSADECEELFTSMFDVTPACVAYVSIHLFGEENFKRGEFMAALNARYEQSGFDPGCELPDQLGVLLRFAATISGEERRELTQFCLLGPIEKMIKAQTSVNPYRALLETVQAVLRTAYPGMEPALSPLEQMRQHGANYPALSSGCGGCGLPGSGEDEPAEHRASNVIFHTSSESHQSHDVEPFARPLK